MTLSGDLLSNPGDADRALCTFVEVSVWFIFFCALHSNNIFSLGFGVTILAAYKMKINKTI